MSDKWELDRVQEATEVLLRLLHDRQGAHTWAIAVGRRMESLRDVLVEHVGPGPGQS